MYSIYSPYKINFMFNESFQIICSFCNILTFLNYLTNITVRLTMYSELYDSVCQLLKH